MDGKVDWMAFGFPVEGDDGPFLGGAVTPVRTCEATGTVGEARRLLPGSGVVVVMHDGLAVGEVDDEALAGSDDDRPVLDALRPVPSTYRPSVTVSELAGDEPKRVLVSTPDGRLLGETVVEPDHDHDHGDHDHGDHDHGDHDHGGGADFDRMAREMEETMGAVAAHFGDREPPEDELRAFLRDRLVAEGRSAEEADRFMAELDDNS